jgi:hypothetical protein
VEGSLEFRHRRQPGNLQEEFVRDPADFVARLLVEFPKPKSKDELLQYLSRYGIQVDTAAWKKLQPRLRKHPGIALEGDRYGPREVGRPGTEPADVDTLLLRAMAADITPDERRRVMAALAELSGALDPARAVLARAAGCRLESPEWGEVRLTGLDDRLVGHLLNEAASARAWPFLLGVALDTSRLKSAARAVEILAEVPNRSPFLSAKIDELARDLSSSLDPRAASAHLDRRLTLLLRIAGSEPDEHLIPALLRLATTVGLIGGGPETPNTVCVRILAAAADMSGSGSVLASTIAKLKLRAPELDVIKGALSGLAVADSARRRWLRALATSGPDELLASESWWSGATLIDLAQLAGDAALGPILRRHPEIGDAAISRALAAKTPAIGTVLDLPSWLVRAANTEALISAVNRLEQSHPLRTLLASESQRRVEAARVEAEDQVRDLETAHRSEAEALRAELESMNQQLATEKAHAGEVASRLRRAIGAADTDSAADRRQARLDVLVALAGVASEVERSLAALTSGTLTAEDAMNAILLQTEVVGVVRDAAIGTAIDLDRTKYRLIGDDDSVTGPVVVVEPAYLTFEGGEVTVLRFGKVSVPVGR